MFNVRQESQECVGKSAVYKSLLGQTHSNIILCGYGRAHHRAKVSALSHRKRDRVQQLNLAIIKNYYDYWFVLREIFE